MVGSGSGETYFAEYASSVSFLNVVNCLAGYPFTFEGSGTTDGFVFINQKATTPVLTVTANGGSRTSPLLILKQTATPGAAADPIQVQDSTGAVLAKVDNAGEIWTNGVSGGFVADTTGAGATQYVSSIMQNTTAATLSVPVQLPPGFQMSGSVWDTGLGAPKLTAWDIFAVGVSGNPAYETLLFNWSHGALTNQNGLVVSTGNMQPTVTGGFVGWGIGSGTLVFGTPESGGLKLQSGSHLITVPHIQDTVVCTLADTQVLSNKTLNGVTLEGAVGIGGTPTLSANMSAQGFITYTGLQATLPPAITWTAPTFINSWVNDGSAPQAPAGYYKDAMGYVHVRGIITGGSFSNTAAFILPTGFRPGVIYRFAGVSNNAFGYIVANPDGSIAVVTGSSWIDLSPICFYADA